MPLQLLLVKGPTGPASTLLDLEDLLEETLLFRDLEDLLDWGPTGAASTLTLGDDITCRSLGAGTNASGISGDVRASGNMTAYFSDKRLKTF